MGPQSESDEIRAAWRALSGDDCKDGWRTIAVATGCACRVLAGRRFPVNEEAILFGFRAAGVLAGQDLPLGRGFEVCIADLGNGSGGWAWVALCHNRAGDLDLFATMVGDVISALERLRGASEPAILMAFLERIRAWQEFMRRASDAALGVEAELGLFGELELLRDLMATGVGEREAIESWKGPLDAAHDFSLMGGAIEVKSTLSPAGFPVWITSLEQLDESGVHPLMLVGNRFVVDADGLTLPELAGSMVVQLASRPPIERAFTDLLLRAGLALRFSTRYTRRFRRVEMRTFEVKGAFPRITRAHAARAILAVRYEIDLDMLGHENISFREALVRMGVL